MVRPQVTEKSTRLAEENVYAFVVREDANKRTVKEAIRRLYNVLPRKVNVVNMPAKQVSGRGRGGTRSGFKKALVYLKEGDSIDIT